MNVLHCSDIVFSIAVLLLIGTCPLYSITGRESSVGTATGYGLDDRMTRVRFPEGARNFFFDTVSRPALGPTQPPTQWVKEAVTQSV